MGSALVNRVARENILCDGGKGWLRNEKKGKKKVKGKKKKEDGEGWSGPSEKGPRCRELDRVGEVGVAASQQQQGPATAQQHCKKGMGPPSFWRWGAVMLVENLRASLV